MKPQVVIIRKDKRVHKKLHLLAFMLTGGASAAVTAVSATNAAAYNRRTRKLSDRAVKFTAEEIAYMKAHTAK
jgi:hypothetical protein